MILKVLLILTAIIILQGMFLCVVFEKLKITQEALDYAYSPEGQRKITTNTIKNRMWY